MQYRKQILVTGILFLCLVSCVSALEVPYDASFVGTEWSVTSFLSGSEMISVLADFPITMNFGSDGWVFGSAGCNRYSGSYELGEDSHSITIGSLLTTRMMCEQVAMDQEAAFTQVVTGVASYSDGDVFVLNNADGEAIVIFESTPEPKIISLTGTTWNLAVYGLENNVPPEGVIPTLVFLDDGMLSGMSGCNSFFGQYQTDGETMSIGQMGSTLMLCFDDATMQLEAEYLALLQHVAAYAIDGTFLTLYDENSVGILFFKAEITDQIFNTLFELRSFTVDGEMRYVITDSIITFEIAEDGTISGNAGCNTYSAVATFNADDPTRITIAPGISTMMFCIDERVMEQESAYLAMLPSADSFTFDGTNLKLYDANGEVIATFTTAT